MRCVVLLLLALTACRQPPAPITLDHPWPTQAHDNARTARSHLAGPEQPTVLWSVRLQGHNNPPRVPPRAPLLVSADGRIYCLVDMTYLNCVEASGKLQWTLQLPEKWSAATLLPDGAVLTAGDSLGRVSPQGEFKRLKGFDISLGHFAAGGDSFQSPVALGLNDYLVEHYQRADIARGPGRSKNLLERASLRRIARGEAGWSLDITAMGLLGNAFACQGDLLAHESKSLTLRSLETGEVLSELTGTGGHLYGQPAFAPDGTVFTTLQRGSELAALDTQGKVRWRYGLGKLRLSDKAVGPDGTLYVAAYEPRASTAQGAPAAEGHLLAFDPRGKKVWHRPLGPEGSGVLVLDAQGRLYVTLRSGIVCFDATGAERWRLALTAPRLLVIGAQERLYVVDADGMLHALGNAPPRP
jgi:outer membrane protein assembly factor BamB